MNIIKKYPKLFIVIFLFVITFATHLMPMFILEMPVYASDQGGYINPAKLFWKTGSFVDSEGNYTLTRAPGYPLWLSLCFWLFNGVNLKSVVVLQVFLYSLLPVFIFWISTRLYKFPTFWPFVFSLCVAFDPFASGQSYFILKEGLSIVLITIFIYSLPYLLKKSSIFSIAVCGVGLAALKWLYPIFIILDIFILILNFLFKSNFNKQLLIACCISIGLYSSVQYAVTKVNSTNIPDRRKTLPTSNNITKLIWQTFNYSYWWLPHNTYAGSHNEIVAKSFKIFGNFETDPEADKKILLDSLRIFLNHPFRTIGRILRINFWAWVEAPGAILLHYKISGGKLIHVCLLLFRSIQLILAGVGIYYIIPSIRQTIFRFYIFFLMYAAIFNSPFYPIPRYISQVSIVIDGFAIIGIIFIFNCLEKEKKFIMP